MTDWRDTLADAWGLKCATNEEVATWAKSPPGEATYKGPTSLVAFCHDGLKPVCAALAIKGLCIANKARPAASPTDHKRCAECGSTIVRRVSEVRPHWQKRRFCSSACSARHQFGGKNKKEKTS